LERDVFIAEDLNGFLHAPHHHFVALVGQPAQKRAVYRFQIKVIAVGSHAGLNLPDKEVEFVYQRLIGRVAGHTDIPPRKIFGQIRFEFAPVHKPLPQVVGTGNGAVQQVVVIRFDGIPAFQVNGFPDKVPGRTGKNIGHLSNAAGKPLCLACLQLGYLSDQRLLSG